MNYSNRTFFSKQGITSVQLGKDLNLIVFSSQSSEQCANLSPCLHSVSSNYVFFHFFACAGKWTRGALGSPRMSGHVSLQPLFGNGTIRALLARIWLFSSVPPHVIPQVSSKVSCVVTVSAFVTPRWQASPPVPALASTVHEDLLSMANLFICCTRVYLLQAQPTQH